MCNCVSYATIYVKTVNRKKTLDNKRLAMLLHPLSRSTQSNLPHETITRKAVIVNNILASSGRWKAIFRLPTKASLVPRLPRSGTRTLKLCRRGEPGIFSQYLDATLIVRRRMRLRTEKGTKVAGNLLHVSSYRASNIIHTERWSIVGWTTRKTLLLPFCLVLFWLRHVT